jgi:hypothetical protein
VSPGRLSALATALATMLLLCAGAVASCAPLAASIAAGCVPGQQPPSGDVSRSDGCDPSVLDRWDAEQVANAAVIVQVGADLQVPTRARVIALAVAMQESSLRNLAHLGQRNDHDSVGLFQQRPSQGWGTPTQLQDPQYAATAFYRALLAVDGWAQMSLAEAGEAVQRSAHPDAYTRWTSDAVMLVAILSPGATGGWVQPLHGPVVSGFGPRDGRLHAGVDITAPRGTIIVAASAGTVATVACNAWHVDGGWWGCDRDGDPQLTLSRPRPQTRPTPPHLRTPIHPRAANRAAAAGQRRTRTRQHPPPQTTPTTQKTNRSSPMPQTFRPRVVTPVRTRP